ncbi:MAG: SagB/ThcOx family dehydrogenase, partial [Nitrospirota bacterium]
MDQIQHVIRYHQETKHHFFRFARSLGYLDWANQPDPFRRFEGSPAVRLPVLKPEESPVSPRYDDLYRRGRVPAEPVSLRSLSRFFEYALAISAWKQAGETRWALRSNPSSGNLHPTEGYLLIGAVPDLAPAPGLYHYAPREHVLERRSDWESERFATLMQAFPPGAFLIAFSSIHWREAWKYGERAFRYCQHDAGHAIGTARIGAAALGWDLLLLEDMTDDLLEGLLGLNRPEDFVGAEREHPDCAAAVWPAGAASRSMSLPLFLDAGAVQDPANAKWYGRANRLSRDEPVRWEIIDEVTAASRKSRAGQRFVDLPAEPSDLSIRHPSLITGHERGRRLDGAPALSAGQIIRQRRSALAFDAKTSISSSNFFDMLARVMPRA